MSTCIVVLGMHRSGTSLVAGLLYRLGIHMGEAFRKPDRHNDLGYYEDLDWRDLNKVIINRAGGRWFNPPNEEDVADVVRDYRERIEHIVRARDQFPIWGFKDPRTAFTIKALEGYLPEDLRFVRVSRNPVEIIASLGRRASIMKYKRTDAHWYSIIARYGERIQTYLRDQSRPVLSIEYEKLLNRKQSKKTVSTLAHFCDLDWRDDRLLNCALELVRYKD